MAAVAGEPGAAAADVLVPPRQLDVGTRQAAAPPLGGGAGGVDLSLVRREAGEVLEHGVEPCRRRHSP